MIKDRPIQMRFIELMQTNDMKEFFEKYHLSGKVLEQNCFILMAITAKATFR